MYKLQVKRLHQRLKSILIEIFSALQDCFETPQFENFLNNI